MVVLRILTRRLSASAPVASASSLHMEIVTRFATHGNVPRTLLCDLARVASEPKELDMMMEAHTHWVRAQAGPVTAEQARLVVGAVCRARDWRRLVEIFKASRELQIFPQDAIAPQAFEALAHEGSIGTITVAARNLAAHSIRMPYAVNSKFDACTSGCAWRAPIEHGSALDHLPPSTASSTACMRFITPP